MLRIWHYLSCLSYRPRQLLRTKNREKDRSIWDLEQVFAEAGGPHTQLKVYATENLAGNIMV